MSSSKFLRLAAAVLAAAAISGPSLAAPRLVTQPAVHDSTEPPPSAAEAQSLQSEGRFAEAAEAWTVIVEHEPDNGMAWFNRAYCIHAAGRIEEAVRAHKKAAEFDDYHGIAMYNLGCAYALLGRHDDAFKALRASQAAGFRLRGRIESDADLVSIRNDERFAQLLANEPAGGGGLGGLGGGPGGWQAVFAQVQQALADNAPKIQQAVQQVMMAVHELMNELAEDERLAPFIAKLQEAMGMAPPQGSARSAPPRPAPPAPPAPPATRADEAPARTYTLADAQRLQQAGSWSEAAKAFSAVCKDDPDNVAAWFGRAYCMHMSGDHEGAIEAHKKSATFPQTKGIALYNLGCAYALTGRKAKAFEALLASHKAGFDVAGSIREDSDLDSLRDDPRYVDLLVELGIEF